MIQERNTRFIPPALQQWEEFTHKIPPFTRYRYEDLNSRFCDAAVQSAPPPVTDSADVVIAGGGLVNMQYALGLLKRGLDVTVIEPYPGETTKALAVSKEIFDIGCRNFSREILEHSFEYNCGEGLFTIHPQNEPGYVATGVLDQSLDAVQYLDRVYTAFTATEGRERKGCVIVDKFDHFRRWKGHTFAVTESGRVIRAHLLLHNTGVNDHIVRHLNRDLEMDFLPIVGVEADVISGCPSGSLFDTIDFSNNGPFGTTQAIWEFLADRQGPVEERRKAVIYLFIRTFEEIDMPLLIDYFFRNLHRYGDTRIIEIHRFLMDHAAIVRDADMLRRSAADGVRVIGPWDFTNNFSGAPFEEHLKASGTVMNKIASAVHRRHSHMAHYRKKICGNRQHETGNPLRSAALEKIRVDRLQRASSKMGRLMCRAIMHMNGEPEDAVGCRMTELLALYKDIGNVQERNRMLYNIIHPGMIARFIGAMVKQRKTDTIVPAVMAVNRDIVDVIGDMVRSYGELLRIQIAHILKHSGAITVAVFQCLFLPKSYMKGSFILQFAKLKQHIAVIIGSKPIEMGGAAFSNIVTVKCKRVAKNVRKRIVATMRPFLNSSDRSQMSGQ